MDPSKHLGTYTKRTQQTTLVFNDYNPVGW